MGSLEGFIHIERQLPKNEPTTSRTKHYKEFVIPHNEKLTTQQAARCMDCGVPFCHNGCPLGNLIPDFNNAVYENNWKKAVDILLSTNNFPEFTGRICPAPCESSCILSINKPPVAIEHIEKTIIEKAFEMGYIKPHIPKVKQDEKVAVIGSGPAGMAAADQLNQMGYAVTLYERDEKPGGLLRFGIPDFKLEKWIVERRVTLMEKEGVTFNTCCEVGIDISIEQIRDEFDAVLLAIGSTVPNDLKIPGRGLSGIHFAMDFLTQQNKRISGLPFKKNDILATDKHVIVIGGGDTGSDCIGTSNRQGAKSILQFELLDKPPTTRSQQNPWPEWPLVLRASSSHEEGCQRAWSLLTKEFIGNSEGKLTGILTEKIRWKNGQFHKIENSEKIYPCDLTLLAIGFAHPLHDGLLKQLPIELTKKGNVHAVRHQTAVPNIFTAGDMHIGQSLVVSAINEGRKAAKSIHHFFQNNMYNI